MAIRHLERLKRLVYFKDTDIPCVVREMHDAPSNDVIAMHDHEFSELAIIASGSLNHIYSGGTVRLSAGDFFVIHPGERHGYAELARQTVVFNLLYRRDNPPPALLVSGCPLIPSVFPGHATTVKADKLGHVPRPDMPVLVNLIKAVKREETGYRPLRRETCAALFLSLLLLLARAMKQDVVGEQSAIQGEIDFIGQNYERKITLSELCAVSGKSISTLSREFKKNLGRGPGDYIIELRLAKARELLTLPGRTLESTAAQTGFCNASHLLRTLRARSKQPS